MTDPDTRADERNADRLHVAVTGSSGLIGSALLERLTTDGHQVTRIVRRSPAGNEIRWAPNNDEIDSAGLEGVDAAVHLAAEDISKHRWTDAFKSKIRDSRVTGTRVLCQALANLKRPPQVLVMASAIGYYGDRGDETLDEASSAGDGFLSRTCLAWENACAAGSRGKYSCGASSFWFGVESARGGSLAKMLRPFKWGLGGRIGNGRQFWSWISIDDAVGAILHAVRTDTLGNAINAVSPHPVTNREFTRNLGGVLKRPTLIPAPAIAVRVALGQMADDCILASTRVIPKRLLESGYEFRHAELEPALRHLLNTRS